jgi:hypothetical protein
MKKYGPVRFLPLIYSIMRLSAFVIAVICCTAFFVFAHPPVYAQNPLDKTITINLNNEPLKQALDKITAVSGVNFTYSETVANSRAKIKLQAENKTIRQVLNEALAKYPYSFSTLDQEVFIRYDPEKLKKASTGTQVNPVDDKYTISGVIRSQKTGESIIGATVRVVGMPQGTSSNEYGFYSLTLPKGAYQLAISAVGQKSVVKDVVLHQDTKLNILLEDGEQELQSVNIIAKAPGGRDLESTQMGAEKLSVRETKNVPVLLGEHDIIKTMQLLPGIKSAGDGGGGFYVRGGSADQNLILLDEAPVYNAMHLLGFFSTFNSDAIKNVTIYKAGMPVQYGGRLSSVLDVKMNDGNNQNYGVSGGIGLIASRINVEGPIQKDKSSFLISARRTYIDAFLKLSKDTNVNRTSLYFYDLNAKANYILGDKDRLYLSGYFGKDVLSPDNTTGINWGNATGTLRWNHLFSNKLFSNTSVIFSNYNYKIKAQQAASNFTVFSQIRDWNVKEDLQWYADEKNTISFGVNSIYHTIKPGEISATGNSGVISQTLQSQFSLENAVYASDSWKATSIFSLTYGVRLSAFSILGPGDFYMLNADGNITATRHYTQGQVVKTYINPEPRIAATLQVNDMASVKASYVRNVQNLHLISNSTSASPTDKWVASTNLIKPEISDQFSVGYYKDLSDHKYELTVESYYKSMDNQIDYRNGADIFTNQPIETQLLYGKGRAYGIEFLIKKKTGRLTGWLSYTLSKTQRKIDGINDNNWYNARQDRTHDIALVTMYQLSSKWTLSANWVFSTGDAVTFPSGKYQVDGTNFYYYTERNAYRMPSYQRLDLGATRLLKQTKKFSSELNFSIYNAYGYANAYRIYFRDSKTDPSRTEAVKTTLFKFVPSVTYNFKF